MTKSLGARAPSEDRRRASAGDCLVPYSVVKQHLPWSPTTLREREEQGLAPKRIRLGYRTVVWSLNEVLECVDRLKAQRFVEEKDDADDGGGDEAEEAS